MPIGPQFPPSAEKRKRADDDYSSDDSDEVGPSLPPANPEAPDSKKQRTIGPSLPPNLTVVERPKSVEESTSDDDGDEDDDDDFGPAPPSQSNTKDTPADRSKSTREEKSSEPSSKPQIVRDEWMTMAPKGGDWSQRVDPTKLKSRKFNTGRSSAVASSGGDSWHETPEQKHARLQRQVLGTKDGGSNGAPTTRPTDKPEDLKTANRIKEYSKLRGPSLYDAHQKKHQDSLDDDPSARAFDKEKDMGAGLQLNSTQRREMLKKSADFNSRFSSAKYS